MPITSNTVYGIINDAMHDAGFLEEGEDPNSEQLSSNFRRLNDIINLWQTQGLKLFLLEELTIPLVAGTSTYSIGPGKTINMVKPSRILDAYVKTPDNVKRPLIAISWKDWNLLPTVSAGTISSYFVNKLSDYLEVRFWNTPSTSEALNTVVALIQREVVNPINLQDDMDFPQEWRIALRWGLADDICSGQPAAIMDRCAQRAAIYRDALESWDVEDASTSFAPDRRSGYHAAGRFV